MAKVTGPLFSMSASGKIADSAVFFGWKGRNVVRQWLIPTNPKSSDQGDQRVIAGGTGRAVGKIAVGSNYAQQLIDLDLIPAGQTKQSYPVSQIVKNYLSNATTYSNELSNMTGHTASTAFGTGADTLGLTSFSLPYASVASYDKRLGVYLLAKFAIDKGFTGAPYDTTLANWTATQINAMVSDLQAA